MSAVTVLGIAGTVQTGKSELAPMFVECGWNYLDLNDPQCDLRAEGTDRYSMFMSQFPGCLKPCGSKTGTFYDVVTPDFYHARVAEDLELVVPPVREWLSAQTGPSIIAWEYLPLIAHNLPIDHTLLFVSDEQIWMERLRTRLRGRGAVGDITDERIRKAIDLLDVWPSKIRADAEKHLPGRFSTFDVSGPDWGVESLRPLLKQLQTTGM